MTGGTTWAIMNSSKRVLQFQDFWGGELQEYQEHIARIFLYREHGRAPTDSEIQELLNDKSQCSKIEDIEFEKVIEAFYDGIAKLNVVTMRCVGYDESLKRSILNKFSDVSESSAETANVPTSSAGDCPNASRRCLEEAADEDGEDQPPGKKARKN
ncbi:hypothetical protein ACEPAG_5832 [Sanghuangporus baumii]